MQTVQRMAFLLGKQRFVDSRVQRNVAQVPALNVRSAQASDDEGCVLASLRYASFGDDGLDDVEFEANFRMLGAKLLHEAVERNGIERSQRYAQSNWFARGLFGRADGTDGIVAIQQIDDLRVHEIGGCCRLKPSRCADEQRAAKIGLEPFECLTYALASEECSLCRFAGTSALVGEAKAV